MSELTTRRTARLRAYERRAAGQSLKAAAEFFGVSRPTMAKWEADPGRIPAAYAEKVERYYGISLQDVFLPNEDN